MCRLAGMVFVLGLLRPLEAAGEKVTIRAGQKAPDFKLKDDKGREVQLSALWGKGKKNVLLAFYPKDFTGG